MNYFEKRIRKRFAALVADPVWSSVEPLVKQQDIRDDGIYDDEIQRHCIMLSSRLGLPIGPATCTWCERPAPEFGDVPDKGPCAACAAREKAEHDAAVARKAAHDAWYASLTPEQQKNYDDEIREMARRAVAGLIARDVQ